MTDPEPRHFRRFEVECVVTAHLLVDEALLESVDDEWRATFYDFTLQQVAEHLAFNIVGHGRHVTDLDGFADQSLDAVRLEFHEVEVVECKQLEPRRVTRFKMTCGDCGKPYGPMHDCPQGRANRKRKQHEPQSIAKATAPKQKHGHRKAPRAARRALEPAAENSDKEPRKSKRHARG